MATILFLLDFLSLGVCFGDSESLSLAVPRIYASQSLTPILAAWMAALGMNAATTAVMETSFSHHEYREVFGVGYRLV